MAVRLSFEKELDQVLFRGNSCVKEVILNRPKKLNSLSYEMISQIRRVLKLYENDPAIKLVIIKGNGRAFCVGGDVVASISCSLLGHWSFAGKFYKTQLHLDYLVATYGKPVACLVDGFVMGGGAGLSMNASFRIVTEQALFAMPEVSMGHFPDVGASYFLSRLPGYFGEYLGLTGARLNGEEMVACGLATHFIPSKDLHLLENGLLAANPSDGSTATMLIEKFAHKPYVNQDSPYNRLETINKCFSKDTIEEIMLSLEYEMESRAEKWIVQAVNSMKTSCPLSLKISLRSIREGRMQGVEQCLIREYNIFGNIITRRFNDNLYEGSRAKLFDRDYKPKWKPSNLEQVSKEMVDQYFSSSLVDQDWEPLDISPQPSNFVKQLQPKL